MATKTILLEKSEHIFPHELEVGRGDTIEIINKSDKDLQIQFCDSVHPFDQDVMFQKTVTIKSQQPLIALVHSAIAFGNYQFYALDDASTANRNTKLATLMVRNVEHSEAVGEINIIGEH
jgi:hypothetical protein